MNSEEAPSITVVCCVEAGDLERQTVRMVASLRHFGERLSDVPVIAVVGRRGGALSEHTLELFDNLNVKLVIADRQKNPASWFGYANKAVAVTIAQEIARSELIAWIDSDVLFASEPVGLILNDAEQFAARSEFLPPSISPNRPNNIGYWSEVLRIFGLKLEEVPWLTWPEAKNYQKMYFNSGVFVWRKSSTFAFDYAKSFVTLLRARIAQSNGAFHFIDQVILTPIILRSRLSWRHLSHDEHCMVFQGFIDGADAAPSVGNAQIIHYSRSLDEPYRARFLERLQREHPNLAQWLIAHEQRGHLIENATLKTRVLRIWRAVRWRIHAMCVRRCVDSDATLPISH